MAFLVTADVPEIYMQEFWAIAKLHQYSIRFKMDTRKHVLDLEAFREMLHISPRIPGQSFDELPFEEEILEFLRFLGHSTQIKTLTHGLYHGSNVDYAYLIWEDFVYQVEHKSQKKSNKMYYPRFTKVIIDYFMTRKPSIPRRNRVNWHYVRDDVLFTTIKVNTQQFGAMLPIELTNEEIRKSNAYKEYYAIATGAAPPKPKASVKRTRSSFDTSITPPTAATNPRLTTFAKGKQTAKALKAKSLSALSEVHSSRLSWATATVHHHAIRFKMDDKKHIVNLESFRDMLHICPRVHGQYFDEPPFEEEILAFILFLGNIAAIGTLTNVNINKLYQPWRSFVEHKNTKKSNEMYYPRFTKVIIHHFMSKDPSIPRRNKVNWHYVKDDHMFSTIKLVSRH
nr:hypothetical protein [Tanacetum cinerariifolium]